MFDWSSVSVSWVRIHGYSVDASLAVLYVRDASVARTSGLTKAFVDRLTGSQFVILLQSEALCWTSGRYCCALTRGQEWARMSLCLCWASSTSSSWPLTRTSMQPVKKADTGVDTSETSARADKQQIQTSLQIHSEPVNTFTNAGQISKYNSKVLTHLKEQ